MRQIITAVRRPIDAEETNSHEPAWDCLAQWAALGEAGLRAEALPLQALISANARFVCSLAHQYRKQGVPPGNLLSAAHRALIELLNHHAHQPAALNKLLAFALREAMLAEVSKQAK